MVWPLVLGRGWNAAFLQLGVGGGVIPLPQWSKKGQSEGGDGGDKHTQPPPPQGRTSSLCHSHRERTELPPPPPPEEKEGGKGKRWVGVGGKPGGTCSPPPLPKSGCPPPTRKKKGRFGHCTAVPVLGCSSREESYPSLANQPSLRAKHGGGEHIKSGGGGGA